jgi:regulator of replication initiation timing
MALPKAVQQQLDEADRLVATINGDKTGENSSETNPENQEKDLLVNVERQDNQPENVTPPDNPVSQETKPAEVPEEKWSHKYHTLKGMYDAEVPRLHSDMREMKAQLQQLVAENATLKEVKHAEVPKAASLITDEDKEAFGPDLIDLIERATDSKVASLRERESQLMSEIKELKGQLGNVAERQGVSEKDRFLAGLSQQVPDWESLNVNSGFLEWLQEVDPVYGIPKNIALTNAYENGDVARVATIFKAYKSTLAPVAPAAKGNQQELQRQVAPTRTRSGTPPDSSASEQYFTHQDIEQFYTDWRRGLYDDAEAVSMEKQIHAAAAEGRIR